MKSKIVRNFMFVFLIMVLMVVLQVPVYASPASLTPIKVDGYKNVFIYLPELSVQLFGQEVSQYGWNFLNDQEVVAGVLDGYEDVFTHLKKYPVASNALHDLNVYVFPVYMFPEGLKNISCVAKGFEFNENKVSNIWIAYQGREALAHELGHVLHYRLFGANEYDWSNINTDGKCYLEVKKYPANLKLDEHSQGSVPWDQRIAEWFAEDTRGFLYPFQERNGGYDATEQYLDNLFMGKAN